MLQIPDTGSLRIRLATTPAATLVACLMLASPGCHGPERSAATADSTPHASASSAGAERPGVRGQRAQALYERLKLLSGDWNASSTKGWGGKITYETIANGTCVMEVDGVAHPESKMISTYVWDIDRVVLTHYCAARNHPRLVATEISPDGSSALFTFIDGTNLPSRDTGHMDSMKIEFRSPDEFASRWTWYGGGKEDWMEEIVHTRINKQPAGAGASP